MIIYRGIEEIKHIEGAVLTTGTFDGVHPGHLAILSRLRQEADIIQGQTVLITFDPHPRLVLNPDDSSLRLLNTSSEKEELLRKAGIDHLIVIPFTKEFASTSSEDYVKGILVERIGVRKLVIGYDHRFGKGRGGSFRELQILAPEYGFTVEEIPPHYLENITVSSTKIRNALSAGQVREAAELLGYNYPLTGIVTRGRQIGRSIGYPTANISVSEPLKLIPAHAIYVVHTYVHNRRYGGMLSIGTNPTVNGSGTNIEVHIFDFSDDIYDQVIRVEFLDKLRNEEKLESLDALREYLNADKTKSLQILAAYE